MYMVHSTLFILHYCLVQLLPVLVYFDGEVEIDMILGSELDLLAGVGSDLLDLAGTLTDQHASIAYVCSEETSFDVGGVAVALGDLVDDDGRRIGDLITSHEEDFLTDELTEEDAAIHV